MKKLTDILLNIQGINVIGSTNLLVTGIETDSRKVQNGSLFVAIAGTKIDGHTFIASTIEKGAIVIVCEVLPLVINHEVTYIQTENTSLVLGLLLSNFYDNPSSKLTVFGVIGTNGKTTTATLLYKLFTKLGYKAGLLSTVVNYIGDKSIEATHTTPDPLQLYTLLHEMVEEGCDYCFMEVSSHAIHQHRTAGIHFAGGVFSNITHDHLDYHKTFDEYLKVKKSFFDNLPETSIALTNCDDKNGMVMLQNTKAKKSSYSCKSFSDFKCKVIEKHFDGMLLEIDGVEVWVKFIGDFNAYNLLAVYASAVLLGQKKDEVLQVISTLVPVDGRFECFRSKNDITTIVDYAHTPDALENVLSTIEKLNQDNKGKVISVVGAGGDRDKTKRPIMAKICALKSDRVIITADNPRSEVPEDIAKDMNAGVPDGMRHKVLTILDRKEAIKTAVFMASPGDIILVAGKGHETYQEIKGVKHHFDDREIVQEVYKSLSINR
jgi:UDP-N-acetylmuramoyl-L-alanyl-D-glutamate--2,6-diaminopimelate ligase